MNRREFLSAGAASLLGSMGSAYAASFPSQPIRMIVPLAAGGLVDVVTRIVADEMRKADGGLSTVVDNRPGGLFLRGLQGVASAPPDGHTVGVFTVSPMTLFPSLYSDYPFSASNFEPITPLFRYHSLLAVRADAPYDTLPEMLAHLRKQGKPLLLGCQGRGAGNHLAIELIGQAEKLAIEPVSFANEPQSNLAMLAGQIPAVTGGLPGLLPHYRAGKVKLLGISSEQRVAEVSEVPTYAELGYPQSSYVAWIGTFAPKNTPAPVVAKLNELIRGAMRSQAFTSKMQPDMSPFGMSPGDFANVIRGDVEKWGALIRRLNLVSKMSA